MNLDASVAPYDGKRMGPESQHYYAIDVPLKLSSKIKEEKAEYLWDWYNMYLDQYPLLTKMCTGAVCGFLGDLIYQSYRYSHYHIPISLHRMFMFTVVTTFYHAPFIHWWFNFSAEWGELISSKVVRVPVQILADNLLFCPVINPLFVFFAAFLCTPDLFKAPFTKSLFGAIHQMNTEAWPVLQKCWSMWPIVHFFNYGFVEPKHRVLVVYLASIGWKFMLSSCIH